MKTKLINILLFVIVGAVLTITACKKQDVIPEYHQDVTFFKRNGALPNAFSNLNGSLTDEILLNKLIAEFKDYDNDKHIADDIKLKFGNPQWDISIVLKNRNGYKTIATPISNSQNEVTAIAMFYQKSSNDFDYKIIDRKIKQKRLPEYGNKEATIFTRASLQGLFQASDKSVTIFLTSIKFNNQVTNNSVSTLNVIISWICWSYSTYTTLADGTWSFTFTETQCTYNLYFIGMAPIDGSGGNFGSNGGVPGGTPNPNLDLITYETITKGFDCESCKVIITHHSNGLSDEESAPFDCEGTNEILGQYNSIKDHTTSGHDPYFKPRDTHGNPQMVCPILVAGISATFTWEKVDDKINISGYSTELVGFSPCLSLKFQNGSPSISLDNIISFSINAILSYSLLHPQVIVLKSKPVRIDGTFNTSNGNYTINVHG